jgi:16S rRNA G1207 methylase RsmC
MEEDNTYEVKIGTTIFVVSRKYSGKQSLEEVLKTAIKRRIESEAMETRYKA